MFSIYKINQIVVVTLSLILIASCFTCEAIAEDKVKFLKSSYTKDGVETRRAFQNVITQPLKSIFQIQCDDDFIAYGVVVDSNGLAVTKASEVHGEMTCTFADGRVSKAKVVDVLKKQDLALIQLEKGKYQAIKWSQEKITVGQWVVIPGIKEIPEAIGIVSGEVIRIPANRGYLGINLNSDGSRLIVTKVIPGSGASKAEIKIDDVLVSIDGQQVKTKDDFKRVLFTMRAGDTLRVGLNRNSKELFVRVVIGYRTGNIFSRMNFQNQMGGYLSLRRSGFPSVFSHDANLKANQCGGVLVNLKGEAIGINIARASRTDTYVIPVEVVQKMMSNYKK